MGESFDSHCLQCVVSRDVLEYLGRCEGGSVLTGVSIRCNNMNKSRSFVPRHNQSARYEVFDSTYHR